MGAEKVVCIYALCDPRNEAVGYVGSSFNPAMRFAGHKSDMLSLLTAKAKWLRQLRREGVSAKIVILERVPVEQRLQMEALWTEKLRTEGHPITNGVRTDTEHQGAQCGDVKEVAAYLNVPVRVIRRDVASGQLPHRIYNGRVLIWWAALEDYIPSSTVSPKVNTEAVPVAGRVAALERRVAKLERLLATVLEKTPGKG